MKNSTIFVTMGTPYEYIVIEKMTLKLRLKKIIFIALYILWGCGVLIGGTSLQLVAPLLAFIPISIWILVWLTWRFTQVSYEYTFESGTLKVNRILGEHSHRKLAEVKIRDIEKIYINLNEDLEKVDTFSVDNKIFAASAKDAERLTAIIWVTEDKKKNVLYMEADEKALKILRYYKSSLFDDLSVNS